MAAITATQKKRAAGMLAKRMFPQGTICNLNQTDLEAAIQSIDDGMEGNASLFNGATPVVNNFAANLPEPFKANSTVTQKAGALAVWSAAKYGI